MLFVCSIFCVGCASTNPRITQKPLAPKSAENFHQAAQLAERQGDWKRARDHYAILYRCSPGKAEYSHRLAIAYTQLGEHRTATQFFEIARRIEPQNSVLLSDIGYAYLLQKEYALAEKHLTEALRLQPTQVKTINNLAMAIAYQGRFEESLQTFRKANSEQQSLLHLAAIQSQMDKRDAAIATYQKVIASDPENQVAVNALQQLQPGAAASSSGNQTPASEPATPVSQPGNPVEVAVKLNVIEHSSSASTAVPTVPNKAETSQPDLGHKIDIEPRNQKVSTPATTPVQQHSAARSKHSEPNVTLATISTIGTQASVGNSDRVIWTSAMVEEPLLFRRPAPLPILDEPSTATAVTELAANQNGLPVMPEATSADDFQSPRLVPDKLQLMTADASKSTKRDADRVLNPFDEIAELSAPALELNDDLMPLDWIKRELELQELQFQKAETPQANANDCFRGFCPVAIRNERRLIPSKSDFNVEFEGVKYQFSSLQAAMQFRERPDWYVPVRQGCDVVESANGRSDVKGILNYAIWFRQRLYMFSTPENLASFRLDPRAFADK